MQQFIILLLYALNLCSAQTLWDVRPRIIATGAEQPLAITGSWIFPPSTVNVTFNNGSSVSVPCYSENATVYFPAPNLARETQINVQIGKSSLLVTYYDPLHLQAISSITPSAIQVLGFDNIIVTLAFPWIWSDSLCARLCVAGECITAENIPVKALRVLNWMSSQFTSTINYSDHIYLYLSPLAYGEYHLTNVTITITSPTPLRTIFLYADTVSGAAWTRSINDGRFVFEEEFKSRVRGSSSGSYLENVWQTGASNGLSDMMKVVDNLISENITYFIMGSATFYDLAPTAAAKYPRSNFLLVSDGRFDLGNVSNLAFARGLYYEGWYLAGLAAGATTRTNKIAFFITYPFPSYINMANAYILGVKRSNPVAIVIIFILNTFADTWREKSAAEHAFTLDVDVYASIASDTIPLYALSIGKWAIGYGDDMRSKYGDLFLLSIMFKWGSQFIEFGQRLLTNRAFGPDIFEVGYNGDGIDITTISPIVPTSTSALIAAERARLMSKASQVFCGFYTSDSSDPIYYSDGSVMVANGQCLSVPAINGMFSFLLGSYTIDSWSNALSAAYSSSMIILAFAIATLSSWSSLIVLDQALSTASHHGWKRSLWWNAGASLALGIGIWASMVVGFTAFTLPTLVNNNILYAINVVVGCLPLAPCLTFLSFAIMLVTIQNMHKRSGEQMAAVGVGAMAESVDTGTTSEQTVTVLHPTGHSYTPSSNRSKKLFTLWWVKLIIYLLAGGTLNAAIFGTHYILASSLQMPVDITMKQWMIALSVFLHVGFLLPALWIFFHLRGSNYRFVGALLMGIAIGLPHFLLLAAMSFSYRINAVIDKSISIIEADTMQIVGVSVACVSAFLFVGFNVVRLRLSRDVLDNYVHKVQKEFRQLTANYRSKMVETEMLQSTINGIHLIRPLAITSHYLLKKAVTYDEKSPSIPGTVPGAANDAAILTDDKHIVTLEEILTNDITLEILKDHAIRYMCSESLMLWLHIRDYKANDGPQRQVKAELIRTAFLESSSPHAVNISEELRTKILTDISRTGSYSDDLWDIVEQEIKQLIHTNIFNRFKAEKDGEILKACASLVRMQS